MVKTGRSLSGLAVVFLLIDGAVKLVQPEPVIAISHQLGYAPATIFGIGITLLVCLAVYLMPQTSVLGALLLTGYLGGAVSTHVRIGSPLLTHVLFPTYIAVLLWGGLLLRHPSLRVVLPFQPRA
jgi:hypothetical protein